MESNIKFAISDRLPYQKNQITYIAQEVFEQQHNFKFIGDNFYFQGAIIPYVKSINTEQNTAIINMGNAGFGLFANQELPAGFLLCVYNGEIIPLNEVVPGAENQTCLAHANPEFHDNGTLNIAKTQYITNSQKIGGLNRFLQHLPTETECDHYYHFHDPLVREKVATQNLLAQFFTLANIENTRFSCYHAARTIQEGEIVGYDYGTNYWQRRQIEPKLFFKSGEVVTNDFYTVTHYNIAVQCDNVEFELSKAFNKYDLLIKIIMNAKLVFEAGENIYYIPTEKLFPWIYNAQVYQRTVAIRFDQQQPIAADLSEISQQIQQLATQFDEAKNQNNLGQALSLLLTITEKNIIVRNHFFVDGKTEIANSFIIEFLHYLQEIAEISLRLSSRLTYDAEQILNYVIPGILAEIDRQELMSGFNSEQQAYIVGLQQKYREHIVHIEPKTPVEIAAPQSLS
jgi:hypothetical protein